MLVNSELEGVWKEVVVYWAGEAEENHEKYPPE
jgi:hypothetical protein